MEVEAINNQLKPVTYSVTEQEIEDLKAKYRNVEINDNGGYKLAVAGISETRVLRINIEKRRKQLKAGALEFGRRVDSFASDLTQKLLEIEKPLKEAKGKVDEEKALEQAEKKRLEKERVKNIWAKIESIMELTCKAISLQSAQIKESIANIKAIEIDEQEYQEFTAQARAAKTTVLIGLTGICESRERFEIEEARLNKERDRQRVKNARIQEEKRQLDEKQKKVRDEEARKREREVEEKRLAAAQR